MFVLLFLCLGFYIAWILKLRTRQSSMLTNIFIYWSSRSFQGCGSEQGNQACWLTYSFIGPAGVSGMWLAKQRRQRCDAPVSSPGCTGVGNPLLWICTKTLPENIHFHTPVNPPTSAATILPQHILSFTSHNTIWSRGGAGAVVLSQNLNISVYFYPKIGQNIILDQGDTFPPPHLAKSQSVMDFVMSSLIKYAPIYRHQYISLVGLVLLGFTMTMTECSRCMRLAMITTLHPPL